MIRVIVADDHPIVRQGLERLIATAGDLELVGMAADGAEAVDLARERKPDIVLSIPAVKVPAQGILDYTHPVVPMTLPEGRWMKATTLSEAMADAGAKPIHCAVVSNAKRLARAG